MLDLQTRKVFIYRAVIFMEDCFPFHHMEVCNSHVLFTEQSASFTNDLLFIPSSEDTHDTSIIQASPEAGSSEPPVSTSSLEPKHAIVPVVSQRPVRSKLIPRKYKDFTGFSANFAGSIPYPFSLSYMTFSFRQLRFLS